MSNARYNKGKSNAERVALLDDFESDDDFFLKGPSSANDKVLFCLILFYLVIKQFWGQLY